MHFAGAKFDTIRDIRFGSMVREGVDIEGSSIWLCAGLYKRACDNERRQKRAIKAHEVSWKLFRFRSYR
jgi:hypothetical protein